MICDGRAGPLLVHSDGLFVGDDVHDGCQHRIVGEVHAEDQRCTNNAPRAKVRPVPLEGASYTA